MGDTSDTPIKKHNRQDGKIAQLEQQRRILRQKELSNGDVNDGFAPIGEVIDEENIPLDERLAMTFNSLRVLVTILRPVLSHADRQNYEIKMKKGPSIERATGDRKQKKKAYNHYLFFDNVYSRATVGSLNELNRDLNRMLEDLELEVDAVMNSKRDGIYQCDFVDQIRTIIERGQRCADADTVANLCFENMPRNTDVEARLHEALMKRFDFTNDKKQEALKQSIDQLQEKLTAAISSRMSKGTRLTVYGSCLSGLNLEGSHDVDVSVHLPQLHDLKRQFDNGRISASGYDSRMRSLIYKTRDAITSHKKHGESFIDLIAITKARVPVIKGVDRYSNNPYSDDGHLHFDLCFLNDIAVVNSSLLREYSLLDKRVRVLMLCVKSFAKKNGISSAADSTFSSYSWLNLVVFYLQCIGFLPVLQCPKLMAQHGFIPDVLGNSWHSVNSLETYYLTSEDIKQADIWKQPSRFTNTTMPELLFGFFSFYSEVFPRDTVAASIRVGDFSTHKAAFSKSSKLWRMCVEDPFETWDSHCPHDLGSHVNEYGQQRILDCFRSGLHDLRSILEDNDRSGKAKSMLKLIEFDASTPQVRTKNESRRNRKKSTQKTNNSRHSRQEKPQLSPPMTRSASGVDQQTTANTTLNAIQQVHRNANKNSQTQTSKKKIVEKSTRVRNKADKEQQSQEGGKANGSGKAPLVQEKKKSTRNVKTCNVCGEVDHLKVNCPQRLKFVKCRYCGTLGHIEATCPSITEEEKTARKKSRRQTRKIKTVRVKQHGEASKLVPNSE